MNRRLVSPQRGYDKDKYFAPPCSDCERSRLRSSTLPVLTSPLISRSLVALLSLSFSFALALSGCSTSNFRVDAIPGTLAVSPSSVTFGPVPVGQTATSAVSVINGSTAAAVITRLDLTGNSFTVAGSTNFPITVAPGGTYRLNVLFNPSAVGAASGQLTITSNAFTGGNVVVALSGTGTTTLAALSGLSCSSSSITGSGTDACAVTLTSTAPSGGYTISLSSTNAAVTVPATVTVPANASSAGFTATVSSVGTAQAVTLTATAGSVTSNFALQLNAAVPTLTASTASIGFGNVQVDTTATQSVTLVSTGTAPVVINSATLTGTGFSLSGSTFPAALNPGQAATLNIEFDPATAGAATGQITVSSNSTTNATAVIALIGTGTTVPAALSGLSCSSSSITGAGTDACAVTLTSTAPSGGFSIILSSSNAAVTVPATVTVPANGSSAGFTATVSSVGTAQAVTLTANAGSVTSRFALQLNAAVPTLTVNATSVGFGDVQVDTTATQSVTLTSTGTAPVVVNSATLTGTGFSLSGSTYPATLNPGQTATLTIEFDPATAGAATGQITVSSNSSTNGTAVIALNGTGTGTTASHEVNLSWNAPSGSTDPIVGYNVYRSPSGSSTFEILNSSLVTFTTYADTTVQSGEAYDYIATSVDDAGVESAASNMFGVTIP